MQHSKAILQKIAVATLFDPSNSSSQSNQTNNSKDNHTESNKDEHCIITIKPHQGGLESRDFCTIIQRMLEKYCNKNAISLEILEESDYSIALKINVSHKKFESLKGLHKIVRVSPFSKGDKLHTSLAKVSVINPKKKKEIVINPNDLRIDFYKSTGPGGQHRNKRMSAVRIVHIPTNTVVTSCAERSQHDNRQYAMEQLYDKLQESSDQQDSDKKNKIRLHHLNNDDTVASYYFNHQLAVHDRNGKKTTRLKNLLNGDLELIFA